MFNLFDLFRASPAPAPAPITAPVPGVGTRTARQAEVHVGQVQDTDVLTNDHLVEWGRGIVGAGTSVERHIDEHIDALAAAQGDGSAAKGLVGSGYTSDARRDELRVDADGQLASARLRLERAEERVLAAQETLSRTAESDLAVVPFGVLIAFTAGVASAVVLTPSVILLLGTSFADMVEPENVKRAAYAAALAFGLVPPLGALVAALGRANPWKITAMGALELALLALLAKARADVLGAVPTDGLDAGALAAMAAAGTSRSMMMFAIEALLVAVVNAVGIQVSSVLNRADLRKGAEGDLERAVEARRTAEAAVQAGRDDRAADLELLCRRDVASERGEKVRALTRELMRHGALEQVQANADALNGAPRAKVGAWSEER